MLNFKNKTFVINITTLEIFCKAKINFFQIIQIVFLITFKIIIGKKYANYVIVFFYI